MALPVGISTCTVNVGTLSDFAGDSHEFTVEWQPVLDGKPSAGVARSIVWAATGDALVSFPEKPAPGTSVSFAVPHVDQPGFIDGTGGAFTNWAYRVTVTTRDAGRKTYTKTKVIQVFVGQASVDFDLVTDGWQAEQTVASAQVVTSINGEVGEVELDILSLPVAQADVAGLPAALAGKANQADLISEGALRVAGDAAINSVLDGRLSDGSITAKVTQVGDPLYIQVREVPLSLLNGPQAVDPTGVTDSGPAIQAALDAAAAQVMASRPNAFDASQSVPITRTFEVPDGVFKTNQALRKPQGLNIRFADAATIKAGSSMTSVFDTDPSLLSQDEWIRGGTIDCNGNAQSGFIARYFAHLSIQDVNIYSPTRNGLILGDPAAVSASYEAMVKDIRIWRPRNQAIPAGYAGVWVQRATDSRFDGGAIVGNDVGVKNDGSSNSFDGVHVWNASSVAGPTTCFHDTGSGNTYDDCYADTPSVQGWKIAGASTTLMACRAYGNASMVDNTVTAVQIDGTPYLNVFGLVVRCAQAANKWKTDYAATVGATGFANVSAIMPLTDGNAVYSRAFNTRGRLAGGLFIEAQSGLVPFQIKSNGTNAMAMFEAAGTQRFEIGVNGTTLQQSTKGADYTLTLTDRVVLFTATATATLPSGTVAGSGARFTIKNRSAAGTVTVVATAGTVDSFHNSLAAGQFRTYESDGTNWWAV